MKKGKIKCSVRLSEDEIRLIEEYPGRNFSEKTRNLLTVHMMNTENMDGDDLKEKIEILLKGYFSDYNPMIRAEIEERRNELKKYLEILLKIIRIRLLKIKRCKNW